MQRATPPSASSPVPEDGPANRSETATETEKEEQIKENEQDARPDRTLLTYKAFYFFFSAGFGSTFPYLTIYFKQLGLTASYVGTLSGIRPLVQFVSGQFWAYLADKYRSRKLVLCMSVVAWLVFTLALAFPHPKKTKCEQLNSTIHVQKRDVHRALSYPGLPLAPIPAAISEGLLASKKSTISFTVKHAVETTKVIVHDKAELRNLFYIFLVLIVVGEVFEAPSFIMIDTALIQKLGDKCHNYGKTRCFGSLGYGLASFGVGAVLDTTRYVYCGREMNNYMVIFYFFAVFMAIGLIFAILFFTFKYNENSSSIRDSRIFEVYKVCLTVKYASFLLTAWFMGMSNGGQVTFINWYLEDLGATKFMMGLTTTTRASAVIVGFFCSGVVINKLGELPTVFWSLLIFAVIFFGYSYLTNPWLVLPLEILQGLVYAISWSTCIVYLSAVTPDDGAATMQSECMHARSLHAVDSTSYLERFYLRYVTRVHAWACPFIGILQGIYWGLGTGIGAILGGFLISQHGIVSAYRIGGAATIVITFYFVVSQWLVRKYETSMSSDKDEVKPSMSSDKEGVKPISNSPTLETTDSNILDNNSTENKARTENP